MTTTTLTERDRNLLFLSRPALWPAWPYLPLLRRRPGRQEEYGVLYDVLHLSGRTGFSATVFLSNLFFLPDAEEEILALPHEAFDTPDEVFAAGWRVD
jgi:hypothetical protein